MTKAIENRIDELTAKVDQNVRAAKEAGKPMDKADALKAYFDAEREAEYAQDEVGW